MVAIKSKRLKQWQDQINRLVSTGNVELDFGSASFDRFISTYVIDLSSDEEAIKPVHEAHWALKPDGLLDLASIALVRSGKYCTGMRVVF